MKSLLILLMCFCLAPGIGIPKIGAQVMFTRVRAMPDRVTPDRVTPDSAQRDPARRGTAIVPTAAHYLEAPAGGAFVGTTPATGAPSSVPAGTVPVDSIRVYQPILSERQILDSLAFLRRASGKKNERGPFSADPLPLENVPSIYPIRDGWITSSFGMRRNPVTGDLKLHAGVDLAANAGSPVFATASGMVHKIVLDPDGIGLAVYLRHPGGYMTLYGHLSGYEVKPGQKVRRGRQIGVVGSTGASTGAHVHYAVLYQNKPVDPIPFCSLLAASRNSTYQHGSSRKR